ncbi:MAG: hypothetical protein ACYCS2_02755 [Acidimicrobiales bacterium]
MAADRTWTAADLESVTPDERHRLLNESVLTDPSEVAPEFLVRARLKGRSLLEAREVLGTTQQ